MILSFDVDSGTVGVSEYMTPDQHKRLRKVLTELRATDPAVFKAFAHDCEVLMNRIAAATLKSSNMFRSLNDSLGEFGFIPSASALVEVALYLPSAQYLENKRKP